MCFVAFRFFLFLFTFILQAEDIVTMDNGCVCCTVRGDLVKALLNFLDRRDTFDCILLETTGIADPSPIVATFNQVWLLLRNSFPCTVHIPSRAAAAATHFLLFLLLISYWFCITHHFRASASSAFSVVFCLLCRHYCIKLHFVENFGLPSVGLGDT